MLRREGEEFRAKGVDAKGKKVVGSRPTVYTKCETSSGPEAGRFRLIVLHDCP